MQLSQLSKTLALTSLLYVHQAEAANTNTPYITSIQRNSTNAAAFNITLTAQKGKRVFLQGSPNLTNWINLEATSTNDGAYAFTDIPLEQDRSFFYRAVAERTQGNLAERLADDDAFMGSTNAPVTVVEFADYRCEFCARFHKETFPRIKKAYIDTGKVKFIYRDFPFIEDSSFTAALAAECVRVQGGNAAYWRMHNFLFINRNVIDEVTAEVFADFALQSPPTIRQPLRGGRYLPEVMLDKEDADKADVTGVPTFIINNQRIIGAQPYEVFQQTFDALLEGRQP